MEGACWRGQTADCITGTVGSAPVGPERAAYGPGHADECGDKTVSVRSDTKTWQAAYAGAGVPPPEMAISTPARATNQSV